MAGPTNWTGTASGQLVITGAAAAQTSDYPVLIYCSRADVRALGFPDVEDATDAIIDRAILEATEAIDEYCDEWFLPREATIRAELGGRGIVPINRTVQSITSVIFEAMNNVIAPASYLIHSSTTQGDFDGIHFAVAGWDDTIAGAEREMGGFSALFAPGRFIRATGVYGRTSCPGRVRAQCAILAQSYINGITDVDSEGTAGGGLAAKWFPGAHTTRTTGNSQVDRALRQYRRGGVVFDGI